MADSTGNQPKPTDAKPGTAGKSGAVKPPVLDLKASASGPEAAESTTRPEPADKPADKPVVATAPAPGFAYGAAVTGGVLGLAAAYGLAFFGLWPTAPAAPVATDPRIAQFATAIPELETVTQTTQSELATLTQRVGTMESAAPAAAGAAVDLGPLQADISALGERIDQLASASTAPEGASDELRSELDTLVSRLDELAARVGTAEAGLRSLDTTVTQTSAAIAEQPSDIGAVLQLPLILSGFETAFATGRPYETELGALRAAAPSAEIPTAIANAAVTGLTRPDVIARRFDEVLPAMLAGRPANADAQWQDGALDWFASVIALRPSGEIEGDTPEAIMSRLVGEVERRDFTNAEALLASLPAPMQAAAGEVSALISGQAEAAQFLETLRNQALSGEAAQ